MNYQLWSNLTFSNLMKLNPREAFEYRQKTLGEPIPKERMTAEELNGVNSGEKEYTKEEIMEILKNNNVKFSHLSKTQTLIEKAKENGLI